MSDDKCRRCGERPAGLDQRIPFREALRERVAAEICPQCWSEWQRVQIKVINELALNLGDPRSHDIVEAHARDFLRFSEGETGTDFDTLGEQKPDHSH